MPMGSFHVCDVLNILFKLEKPPIEHLEGFIFLPKKGGELQIFSNLFTKKFSTKTRKNSPTSSTKAGALMVGGMFTVITMSC